MKIYIVVVEYDVGITVNLTSLTHLCVFKDEIDDEH